MIPPQAAIVGTGRSGTGYISEVFRAAGVDVGHEEWWAPNGPKTSGLVADSSWLASRDAGGVDILRLHQVRHPLHVISSLANGDLFEKRRSDHYEIRTSAFDVSGDNLLDAMRCYMAWLRLAEEDTVEWWRVEDVNPEFIQELAHRHFDLRIEDGVAIAAVASVPLDYNAHNSHVELTLDDLPDPAERPVTAKVIEVMAEYGYNPDGTVEDPQAWGHEHVDNETVVTGTGVVSDLAGAISALTPDEQDAADSPGGYME